MNGCNAEIRIVVSLCAGLSCWVGRSAVRPVDPPAERLTVSAVNCGAFKYGARAVAPDEYGTEWEKLAKDKDSDVFFYEDVGTRDFPLGSKGVAGLDIRVALRDGRGDVSVVELPRSIDVGGKTRQTPRYRALRVVRKWNGKRLACYGVHLVAEGHIAGPKPAKGELSPSQKLRRLQFLALMEDAKAFDLAVFAGDFNAQKSFEYEVFAAAGYRIANGSKDFGTQPTLRDIPADSVIVSPDLDFADFEVPQGYRLDTDHFPVVARIGRADAVLAMRRALPSVARYLELPRAERVKLFRNGAFREKMLAAGYALGDGLLSRWVAVDRIPNLRDVGGLPTHDGREIRRGRLYRSAGWNDNPTMPKDRPKSEWKAGRTRLTDKGRKQLQALGIKTDLDLRSDDECWGMAESPLGKDVRWAHVPSGAYAEFQKENGWARRAVGKCFEILADERNYPLVFHCIGGADRTGCLAMMVEVVCGVDEETAMRDWELTGAYTARLNLIHDKTISRFMAILASFPGESPEARMRAFLAACGVTDAQIESVRRILLERP